MATRLPAFQHAKDFLGFVNQAPTPFHAVKVARERLETAGFAPIKERDSWTKTLKPGGKYYLTRNGTSIVAFAIGKAWKPGNPVGMIGAHTDSPCLRIKPVSRKESEGFLQVGVETYGGGLWHTWFDRDLSIAGRVMVKADDGAISAKLIKIDKPILRIPTLAIHLHRQDNFEPNKQSHLFPIAGLAAAELNRTAGLGDKEDGEKTSGKDGVEEFHALSPVSVRHHPYLVELVAEAAGCTPSQLKDFELLLHDTQPACLGGLNDELIFSPRLDNLMMSFCALNGLLASLEDEKSLDSDQTIRLIALFDHEEIGSRTAQGADSNLLPAILRRLSVIHAEGDSELDMSTAHEQTLSTSFLVSADMAHSVHPNYCSKYEDSHKPVMNKGVALKINANARYATNSPGIVLMQEVAQRAKPVSQSPSSTMSGGVPLQLFVVRNDSPCGSTIGPMLSAALGSRTVDLGSPQLSMHSIRETGGTYDVAHAINLFESFFCHFGELERTITVD